MTSTAIVALSRHGSELASTLAASLGGDQTLYLERRFHQSLSRSVPFELPVRPLVQRLFAENQRLVLFMPVGAAVRLLAPCLQDKHLDPAVVCVDDAGRFVVSVLSGHLGGADRLAEEVAATLGATPVITSASHAIGTLAVDLLGQEFGWRIEAEPEVVTRASAAVINDQPVVVYQEAGETNWWPEAQALPSNITLRVGLTGVLEAPCAAALIITDRQDPWSGSSQPESYFGNTPVVLYRPPSLVVGMGCRRGVPVQALEDLLTGTFCDNNLALASLRSIATAELKRDEPGLQQLSDKYGIPLLCYSADELNGVFDRPITPADAGEEEYATTASGTGTRRRSAAPKESELAPTPHPQVHRLLGMWGVSEPAALLAAGSQELLIPRIKTSRATIAVARVSYAGASDAS